jgi:hypothetical protein
MVAFCVHASDMLALLKLSKAELICFQTIVKLF